MTIEFDIVIGIAVVGGIALAIWLAVRDSKRMTKSEWEMEKNVEEIQATAARIAEIGKSIEEKTQEEDLEKVLETKGVKGVEELRTNEDPENRLSATERKFYAAKQKELEEQKNGKS